MGVERDSIIHYFDILRCEITAKTTRIRCLVRFMRPDISDKLQRSTDVRYQKHNFQAGFSGSTNKCKTAGKETGRYFLTG